MRDKTTAEEDPSAGVVPKAPWRVTDVRPLPDYRLVVLFVDGTAGEVDVSKLILSVDAGVFAALRDPTVFAQVYVHLGAVTWPGDIDLAPDAMYEEIKAHGRWAVE